MYTKFLSQNNMTHMIPTFLTVPTYSFKNGMYRFLNSYHVVLSVQTPDSTTKSAILKLIKVITFKVTFYNFDIYI